jgi:hypothetical protein
LSSSARSSNPIRVSLKYDVATGISNKSIEFKYGSLFCEGLA